MPKYTTGELAKLCGVTVRTVQYYDARGILVPGEWSEGGRRLYTEEDRKRLKIICFLREAGLPIHSIGELLAGEDSGAAVAALLEQQKTLLQEELQERQKKLELVEQLQQELKGVERVSVESIRDIAYRMKNKGKLKRLHATMLATGIPLCMVQWAGIALWIVSGQWWLLALHLAVVLPYAVWVTRRYFTQTAYICPQCHEVFKPEFREAFWARHTATLRKLTCTCCGFRGFCVETMEQTPE